MPVLLPGTQVQARGLPWEIVQIEPAGEQERYRLRCLQGDLRGLEMDLLCPFETVEPIVTALDPTKAGRLAPWRLYHQAFLLEQELGPAALSAVQPGRLELVPYQLVPVMRALRMSRPRLLLADGVGLGKTVEAGLVLAELIARRRAHRILIVSPAGPLLLQWQREMRTRFGLRFATVRDWGELQELRRAHELGANPFDSLALCLLSIDFAKQEKVLSELERTTPWDVVIIDEAHHCVAMGTAGDREDSQRRKLAEVLAGRADGLLLLTATPHDGYDAHFASIMELLDPSLVDGRGALRGEAYRRHVIRRLKSHLKDPRTGLPLFQEREVHPCPVTFGPAMQPAFAAFQKALLDMVAPRLKRALRTRRYGEVLAFVALLKRSVSTVAACRNTLTVVRDRYAELAARGAEHQDERQQRLRSLRDYRRRMERFGALSFEEEQDQAALEAEDVAAELLAFQGEDVVAALDDAAREARRERDRLSRVQETGRALDDLIRLTTAAVPEDPKPQAILERLRTIRAAEPNANVLVYTEYTDSQDALVAFLGQAQRDGLLDGEVITLHGADPEKARTVVIDRFSTTDGLVLVSTDASAEGLNLHERCHHLVHLELPYNPNRLEQRNGRIDRYGQRQVPHVAYVYLRGTFEERLLLRLIAKFENQRKRLTFVPNTLGVLANENSAATVRLLEGLANEDERLFSRTEEIVFGEAETVSPDDPAYKELLDEVQRAITGFEAAAKTHTWMLDAGLNADTRWQEEASKAREEGDRQGSVDLMEFVREAVLAETGNASAVNRHPDGTWTFLLPPAWTHGLEDIPGYDAETRTLRLTTSLQQTRDAHDRPLGLLGRAHPVVRRALDRVRNLQFSGGAGSLDRRIAAVRSDDGRPALLYTLLGTVRSAAGREYERLIAVRVAEDGSTRVFASPAEWTTLVESSRALATAGVWERSFGPAWEPRLQNASRAAASAFRTVAEDFLKGYRADLRAERDNVEQWLAARADELCGPAGLVQADIFGMPLAASAGAGPLTPRERLAHAAEDRSLPPARRQEAAVVLSLHGTRMAALDRREQVTVDDPMVLGLLMLVPATGEG